MKSKKVERVNTVSRGLAGMGRRMRAEEEDGITRWSAFLVRGNNTRERSCCSEGTPAKGQVKKWALV